MIPRLRAFVALSSLCVAAIALLVCGELPLDSYVIEHLDQCLIKNNCPILDWAPGSNPFPVLPRQVKAPDRGNIRVVCPNEIPLVELQQYLTARKERTNAHGVRQ